MKVYDCVIIGKGPAGVSAALYTVRGSLSTLIIGTDKSVLKKAEKIENYYGFENPVSGEYLLSQGEKQIKRIGGEILSGEVLDIENDASVFNIKTSQGDYYSKTILIATGQPVSRTGIRNLKDYEGKGVSYCTTCDGFFFRDKKVGVLGYKDFAVHEAEELKAFTDKITIYTNGVKLDLTKEAKKLLGNYNLNMKKIDKIIGEEVVEGLVFEDGGKENIEGLFVAYDSASSVNFALKLGVMVENNSIVVNSKQETNIPGVYAAGDCTGIFKQISVAVGQGAMAGRQIIEYVRKNKN